jgi:hypothetical protein
MIAVPPLTATAAPNWSFPVPSVGTSAVSWIQPVPLCTNT